MKIEVDFDYFSVHKSLPKPMPVIYITGPKEMCKEGTPIKAFVHWVDAVTQKKEGDGVSSVALDLGKPRRTISQMHPAEVREMKEEADANNEHFRKNHK